MSDIDKIADKIAEEAESDFNARVLNIKDKQSPIRKALRQSFKAAIEKATIELSLSCEQWITRCRELQSLPTAIVTNTQHPGTCEKARQE